MVFRRSKFSEYFNLDRYLVNNTDFGVAEVNSFHRGKRKINICNEALSKNDASWYFLNRMCNSCAFSLFFYEAILTWLAWKTIIEMTEGWGKEKQCL